MPEGSAVEVEDEGAVGSAARGMPDKRGRGGRPEVRNVIFCPFYLLEMLVNELLKCGPRLKYLHHKTIF